MKFNKQSFLIIFFGFFLQSFAQNSTFSVKTRWNSLKYNQFRLIYPSNLSSQANNIITNLSFFQEEDSLIGKYNEKRTYIIYGNHAISNGFVGPGPYRSGLFLSPPQSNFIGPGSWVDNLVNHENHHFIQHAAARKGGVKILYSIFGDFADSFFSNVFLLNWFWEGNAVQRESYKNGYGRGNYSHFLNANRIFAQKSVRLKNKRFTYAYNKPLNKNIPNHYNLGYEMVHYLRNSNGSNFLNDQLNSTFRYAERFPSAIRRKSGKNVMENFELALDSIQLEDQKQAYLKPQNVLPQTQKFINRFSPSGFVSETDAGYYLKSTFLDATSLYHNSKKLITLGPSLSGSYRLQENPNFLTWNEMRTSASYSAKSYSDLMVWDKKKNKKNRITKGSKAFSPTLHPKNNDLSYLALNDDYTFSLRKVDLEYKTDIELLTTSSVYLRNLSYSEDGQNLVYIDQKKDRQFIVLFNLESRKTSRISFPNIKQISEVVLLKNHKLFFAADKDLYEYLFEYDLSTKQIRQSKTVCSAIKHLSGKNSRLLFDYQTEFGLRIGHIPVKSIPFSNWENINTNHSPSQKLTHQIPIEQPTVYKAGFPRLKFHSFLTQLSFTDVQVDVFADDFLRKNTLKYTFHQQFQAPESQHILQYTYSHFPIHLTLGATHLNSGTRNLAIGNRLITNFKENKIFSQISYPIQSIKTGFNIRNTPKLEFAYRHALTSDFNDLLSKTHTNLDFENTFIISKNKSRSALKAPLYFYLENRFASHFDKSFIAENKATFGFNIFKNEHFLEGSFGVINENTDVNTYRYRQTKIRPSTGYFITNSSIKFSAETQGVYISEHSSHLSLNLTSTLGYPNMRISDFFFIKRIAAQPFYDLSRYYKPDDSIQDLRAFGSRLIFDIQFAKSLPVQLQLTFAKTPDLKENGEFFSFGLIF